MRAFQSTRSTPAACPARERAGTAVRQAPQGPATGTGGPAHIPGVLADFLVGEQRLAPREPRTVGGWSGGAASAPRATVVASSSRSRPLALTEFRT